MLVNMLGSTVLHNDAALPWQVMFQDPASESMELLVNLHNIVTYYLVIIAVVVLWTMGVSLYKGSWNAQVNSDSDVIVSKYLTHGTLLELVWTVTPALILLAIAVPSFNLLYISDEVISPALTVKVVGHQWYWTYEYSDFVNEDGDGISIDSYMVPVDDLEEGQFRLLDVDNPLVIPYNVSVRFIVTSTDVIHDFAVPSLAIKMDANPGRLNQVSTLVNRPGNYYGQCSELCGAYHAFMPINLKAVTIDEFLSWAEEQLG